MSDYCEYVNGKCKYCEDGCCDFPIQGSGYPYEAPCFGYEEDDDEGEPETGKWTDVVDGIEYTWGICDKCGAHIPMSYKYYEYCPHCGAKMDGEVTE